MSDSNWVYIQSGLESWTIGFYDHDGHWRTDSTVKSKEDAADRVRYLNGGSEPPKADFQDELNVTFECNDDDIKFREGCTINNPEVYSASGVAAVALQMMEEAGTLPDNMSDEQLEAMGLLKVVKDNQPHFTIQQGDNIIKIDVMQFMVINNFLNECMNKLNAAVGSIRRYSGRS